MKNKILGGVVHTLPNDFRKAIAADDKVLSLWDNITPLARNEWICWVLDAKKADTRAHRITRAKNELKAGKRRPCCWIGCTHRPDKPMSASQKWILGKR